VTRLSTHFLPVHKLTSILSEREVELVQRNPSLQRDFSQSFLFLYVASRQGALSRGRVRFVALPNNIPSPCTTRSSPRLRVREVRAPHALLLAGCTKLASYIEGGTFILGTTKYASGVVKSSSKKAFNHKSLQP